MGKIIITQIRSGIDRPAVQKRTLKALGINKMHHSVEKDDNPAIMGMVHSVQHLVKVEKKG